MEWFTKMKSIPFFTIICTAWCLCTGRVFATEDLKLKFSDAVKNYYEPIIVSEILNKNIPSQIMKNYNNKLFRNAIVDLRRLKKLQLPDGRLDAYTFMEGECYFQMNLLDFSFVNYREIVEFFPDSKLYDESLFRIIQIYDKKHSDSLILHYHNIFKKRSPNHILLSGSSFILSKSYYYNEQYETTKLELNNIKLESPYYYSGRFLFAICLIKENRLEEAIEMLSDIAEKSENMIIRDESQLTMGILYNTLDNPKKALQHFSSVSKSSERHSLAKLKKAQIYFNEKSYKKVIKTATPVLKNSNYFFEASLILLDTYWTLKDSINGNIVRNRLSLHAKLTRILIILEEEKIFLQDLDRKLSELGNITSNNKSLEKFEENISSKIEKMNSNLNKLKKSLKDYLPSNQKISVNGIREQKLMQIYNINLKIIQKEIKELKSSIQTGGRNSQPENKLKTLDRLKILSESEKKNSHIISELLVLNQEIINSNNEGTELQPKFIDVGMIMYKKLKTSYQKSNQKIRKFTQRLEELQAEKKSRKQSRNK